MNLTRIANVGIALLVLMGPLSSPVFAQSKPVAVGEIRNIGEPFVTRVNSVAAAGRYAWVGTTDGLFIYDVSTPSAASFVGRERTPRAGAINRVVLSGSYAYLANVGLRIVDTSNPEKPETMSYTDQANNGTNGLAMDLAVAGSLVYLANGSDGLRIYDVSDAYNPTNIGHWPNPNADIGSFRMGIVVEGSYAYLAAYNDGLRVFDVSDPRNPRNIGFVPDTQATKVAVQGQRLYLVSDGLSIYDISNPAQPSFISKVTDAPNPVGVHVDGNFVYVASSGHTIFGPYFYDLADVAHPLRVAPKDDVQSAQGIWDMSVTGELVYMVLDFGVGIYSLGTATSPVLSIDAGEDNSVVLSWPAPSFAFLAQTSPDPEGSNWTTINDVPTVTTNRVNRMVVPVGKANTFFRLVQE